MSSLSYSVPRYARVTESPLSTLQAINNKLLLAIALLHTGILRLGNAGAVQLWN